VALRLQWRDATRLPVAAEGLLPATLAALAPAERALWSVRVGNRPVPLAELFRIEGSIDDGHLVLEGDLRQLRRLGHGMAAGTLSIRGDVGAELGAEVAGGTIDLEGSAGDWAGAQMRGGVLRIRGNAGNFLGAAFPGSRTGMRDGVILVHGNAGDDAGLAMRRGLIAIGGRTGSGPGRAMIAGSIFAFGPLGSRAGAGMKRGTLALFGPGEPPAPDLLPTFVPSGRFRPPFLTIYLSRLKEWGFAVPEPAFSCLLDRYNGDLVNRGQGEVLIAVAS
jgi:formylmethanofuran dehydrogenase subunit C